LCTRRKKARKKERKLKEKREEKKTQEGRKGDPLKRGKVFFLFLLHCNRDIKDQNVLYLYDVYALYNFFQLPASGLRPNLPLDPDKQSFSFSYPSFC